MPLNDEQLEALSNFDDDHPGEFVSIYFDPDEWASTGIVTFVLHTPEYQNDEWYLLHSDGRIEEMP